MRDPNGRARHAAVRIRAVLEQDAENIMVPSPDGQGHNRLTASGPAVGVGTSLQEDPDNRDSAFQDGLGKGGVAVRVEQLDVDAFVQQELYHRCFVGIFTLGHKRRRAAVLQDLLQDVWFMSEDDLQDRDVSFLEGHFKNRVTVRDETVLRTGAVRKEEIDRGGVSLSDGDSQRRMDQVYYGVWIGAEVEKTFDGCSRI